MKKQNTGHLRSHPPLSLLALLAVTIIIIVAYSPVLMPLLDQRLVFAYGDFSTIASTNSSALRTVAMYQTFSSGGPQESNFRAFLLFGVNLITSRLGMTDTQTHSLIMLICIILGAIGLYLISALVTNETTRALLILAVVPFYFLNLWGVERIGHIWIWFAYAIFPLFIALGLAFISSKKMALLSAYSLLLGVFGVFPHNLIYLLILHIFLSAYLILRDGPKKSLMFAIIPIIIYFLLNSPAFLTMIYTKPSYPLSTDFGMLELLSRNGDLANLFTFTNNWWPQVPDNLEHDATLRISSLAIFLSVVLLSFFSYGAADRDQRLLLILSILSIVAVVFVAQGTNEPLLQSLLGWIEKAGLSQLVGPFREWERICIIIPIFMSLIIFIGVSAIDPKFRLAASAVLLLLVAVNSMSPIVWSYLGNVYSAVSIPSEEITIMNNVSNTEKSLVIYPSNFDSILGTARYSWNPDKANGPIFFEQYSTYPDGWLVGHLSGKEAPRPLIDSLGIKYAIKRTDLLGASGFAVEYGWMNCTEHEITVCVNNDNVSAFGIYQGTVLTPSDPDRIYSLSYLPQRGYAPTTAQDASNRYALGSISPSVADLPALYIAKSDRDFAWNGTAGVTDDGWALSFSKDASISAGLNVTKGGMYVLALRGNGAYNVTVDGQEVYSGSSSTANYSFSSPFYLGKGPSDILLSASNGSYFDTIWLFPLNSSGGTGYLDDRAPQPASITGAERDGQTKAVLNISAEKPFLLSFAESYDPLWEAKVYKEGRLVETEKPIPLFGTTDGFWISSTGDMQVVLDYVPQGAFDAGLIVSALTLLGLSGFILSSVVPHG